MQIRFATVTDQDAILKLASESESSIAHGNRQANSQVVRKALRFKFNQKREFYVFLVAEVAGGDLAGALVGYLRWYQSTNVRKPQLIECFVSDRFRGSSIGSLLVSEFFGLTK